MLEIMFVFGQLKFETAIIAPTVIINIHKYDIMFGESVEITRI